MEYYIYKKGTDKYIDLLYKDMSKSLTDKIKFAKAIFPEDSVNKIQVSLIYTN